MAISKSKKRKSHPVRALLLLTQPTAIILLAVLLSLQWRIPTLIQVDMIVEFSEVALDRTEMLSLLESGQFRSFMIKQGEIRYPDFPEMDVVLLANPVKIELVAVTEFQVEHVAENSASQEIRFQLSGLTERIRSVSDEGFRDHRLTQFDRLKHSWVAIFLGIAAWVVFTVIGWIKMYQELNKMF